MKSHGIYRTNSFRERFASANENGLALYKVRVQRLKGSEDEVAMMREVSLQFGGKDHDV
jgi:hypothetical protein